MLDIPTLPLDWLTPYAIPPAWLFYAGALLVAASGRPRLRGVRNFVVLLVPAAGALNLLALDSTSSWTLHALGLELEQLRVDRLSFLFGLLFHIGALLGCLYALRTSTTAQYVAALVYAGSALGAVFAGDLISLFCYWEGMAIASAYLVWTGKTAEAGTAGTRYLMTHLISGLLLLTGSILVYRASGQVSFEFIGLESPAGWLILLAFGIKCGFPLLHNWITDAYPQATPAGTVFLSMFTTKVAVYALGRGFPGVELLVLIGTAMALFPIFYAVIENDLRRVLGYSMINQIGFMVVGVGIGTELALNGTVAHAFNEVLFKGLLFMAMGAVLWRVGHARGSDLGGLYRSMPLTTVCCVVGAASISAFPLFNGFVSKSMIMAAAFEQGHGWVWLGLLFASAGVFHHAGIKIPYFAFFAHDSGIRCGEASKSMLVAMGTAAALCIGIGAYPAALYSLLPWAGGYEPYTYSHVMLQMQLLLFSALAFAWLKLTGVYPPELRSTNLDSDWIYRRAAVRAVRGLTAAYRQVVAGSRRQLARATQGLGTRLPGYRESLRLAGESNAAVLAVCVLLAGYLCLYYLA